MTTPSKPLKAPQQPITTETHSALLPFSEKASATKRHKTILPFSLDVGARLRFLKKPDHTKQLSAGLRLHTELDVGLQFGINLGIFKMPVVFLPLIEGSFENHMGSAGAGFVTHILAPELFSLYLTNKFTVNWLDYKGSEGFGAYEMEGGAQLKVFGKPGFSLRAYVQYGGAIVCFPFKDKSSPPAYHSPEMGIKIDF